MSLRSWLAALALAATLAPAPALARRVHGASLPDPSDPVGKLPDHFVARKPLEKVLRELKQTYGKVSGVVMHRLDAPPSVNAYTFVNTRAGRSWDAINVYEVLREQRVYLSVLPAKR